MKKVCFHGAESTGKSTLAQKLSRDLSCPLVLEYGREYAETQGIDFTPSSLLQIARTQDRLMREVAQDEPSLLLLDTDPLMTAAWAQMLFGEVPERLFGYQKAELYLLFLPDVPWIADGTRFFGTKEERTRFAQIAHDMLVKVGANFETIEGDWPEREAQAKAAIGRLVNA